MKRHVSGYLAATAFLSATITLSLWNSLPVQAKFWQTGINLAQNLSRPKVQLKLTADKKILKVDTQGKTQTLWEPLKGSVVVQPKDILRYTLTSENSGQQPAKNLVITQPIPQKTTYILSSAKANGAQLTFSIDGGKTFVPKPMIKVKLPNGTEELRPAPATAYTHIRWDYGKSLAPLASVQASYEVIIQ